MSAWARRVGWYAAFALTEYVRSGRILVELAATVVVLYVLFWPHGAARPMAARQFFQMGGLFTFALAAYTTAAFLRMGNRPDAYVVLARRLGRAGYLSALVAAAMTVTAGAFVALTAGFVAVWSAAGPGVELGAASWGLGALAIGLDALAVGAYTALAAPLVASAGQRIAALGLLALVANLLMLAPSVEPTSPAGWGVRAAAAVVGTLLSPATAGFALALGRDPAAAATVLPAQLLFAAALLGAALWLFGRRELLFTQ